MGYGAKSITEWQEKAHKIAVEKGWHDGGRTFVEALALIHSEISEVLEWYRDSPKDFEIYYQGLDHDAGNFFLVSYPGDDLKPVGIPIEFADVLIRIFDVCEQYNIPLEKAVRTKMEYNMTRPYRHGGKAL